MDQTRPIIIKRKKVIAADGHHGGAWKVAYADFVTAMMAFFLLMWLLNATSEDQRKGLADFFDPQIPISRNSAGGAGVLNGDSALGPPEAASTRDEGERPKPTHAERGEDLGEKDKGPDRAESAEAPKTFVTAGDGDRETPGPSDEPEEGKELAENSGDAPEDGDGAARMKDVADDLLEQAGAATEDGLLRHFSMRMTPEGLVIELGDLQDEPLFASGNARPEPVLQVLIDILTPVLQRTSNDIAVIGHTDATPFASATRYSNWELSADRANVARRMLGDSGLPAERIVRVSGKAATDPIAEDENAARNRRIAILLLRGTGN